MLREAVPCGLRTMARGRPRQRGISLLEVILALAGFAVAAGAALSAMTSAMSAELQNRETLRAMEGAQSALAAVRSADYATAFVRFNDNAGDDPAGVSPGKDFAIAGLGPRPGDPDGFVGEILFPGDGTVLREDLDDEALGLPRDLNLDGAIDDVDRAADYRLLPVRVRVQWAGATGNRQFELVTVLTEQ